MKRYVPLFVISLIAMPFCKKSDGFCWKCTTTITSNVRNYPTSKVETTVCDISGRDIDNFEKQNSVTTTSAGVTATQSMQCIQKY